MFSLCRLWSIPMTAAGVFRQPATMPRLHAMAHRLILWLLLTSFTVKALVWFLTGFRQISRRTISDLQGLTVRLFMKATIQKQASVTHGEPAFSTTQDSRLQVFLFHAQCSGSTNIILTVWESAHSPLCSTSITVKPRVNGNRTNSAEKKILTLLIL